ncbi:hypothetical protein [Thermogemmatispora onikobensis]|uniref:hypothetical protein n=1 Tax=Thermogemmatispora onikobensis TaxID=732234 RepID=UPI00114CDCB1|nr:hypothetical protein [Thermogemmatispora onikobensis]
MSERIPREGGQGTVKRTGKLLAKESGLRASIGGEERSYVRCVIADLNDPTRHFECRVLDENDLPVAIGEPITLEIIRAITDRRSGQVRFDCRWVH